MKKTDDSPFLSSDVFRFGIPSDLLYPDPGGRLKQCILLELVDKARPWNDATRKQFSAEAIHVLTSRKQEFSPHAEIFLNLGKSFAVIAPPRTGKTPFSRL